MLVYALTGKAPYSGDSDEATLWAHLNAPPPSESVPPEFEGVVARALAKDPSDRYLSAGDLGRAALRAAGRSATSVPERNVGRGLAAPATDDTARHRRAGRRRARRRPTPTARRGLSPGDARDARRCRAAAPDRRRAGAPRRPPARRRAAGTLALAAGAAALVAVAARLVACSARSATSGGDGRPTAAAAQQTTAGRPPARRSPTSPKTRHR